VKHRVVRSVFLTIASLLIVTACERSATHEHEHAPASASENELEPLTATVFGEQLLLFMEYPPLVRGTSARFLVHLSVAASGEPVRAGRVVLEVGSASLEVDAPKREGLFVPEGAFTSAGVLRARLSVTGAQAQETLDLGEIVVHESIEQARTAAESNAAAHAANEVPFLMEQQWKVKLIVAEARPRTLSQRLVVPARTRIPDGALASASAPAAGRLLGPSAGKLPRTGDHVEAGQLLGFIEPPLAASDVAQLQALSLDLDLKVLEVTRVVSAAQAGLRLAERERERIAKLREEGLGTQQQLDQAERNLSVARTDAEAARATKDSLDGLIADRATRHERGGVAGVRLPVRAPIAGTVISALHVEGESVGADAEIVRILDASHLWIEGRVSEFDLRHVKTAPAASVSFPALAGERIDVPAAAVATAYIAPTIDPASRTFSIRYELPNSANSLKDGMLAQLALVIARADAAVTIPHAAVILDQGIPTAYVMLSGETFQKRELELGVRDGDLVEVLQGIHAGERVATRGAYIVRLAALSPASFGAGHAH
jgi:membrane fusion protein, heavy metal efflux system